MRRIIWLILLVAILIQPVSAAEFTAPEVPESGQEYMPENTESFGEGLWYVIKSAISAVRPTIAKAAGICLSFIAMTLLISMLDSMSAKTKHITEMAAAVGCGVLMFSSADTLINLGADTVNTLSEYGKLLIPVMTAAMAAQGGVSTSAALYTGTTLFSTLLSAVIAKLIVPMLYIFLCLCIADCAIGEEVLKKMKDFTKWLITWSLKVILYVFTGYISVTGVVGGSADASMVKATKLAISGSVPVVGSILSDASETILVSAGVMKSAAGVYGVLAIIAVWIGPFLEIGIQYLLLKLTAATCGVLGSKKITDLIQDFAASMGFVLAMISTILLLLLIGVVCYMKGVS